MFCIGCGDNFDDDGEFQMQQGLGPALDRSPVANTCFWIGKIVGDVDGEGKIMVGFNIYYYQCVVEELVEFFHTTHNYLKKKTGSFRVRQ